MTRPSTPSEGAPAFAINRELAIWGTLSADFVDRNASQGRQSDFVEVDCVTFDEVLREHGMPHYLKIDIEGREMACLEALRGFASRPRYLSVESRATSPGYGFRDALAELRFLRSLGYTRFKYVDQALIPGTVTSFSVEGVPVVHEFSEDSSGPFGEEAPGRWRSLALGAVSGIGLRLAEDLCGHSGRLYHRFGRSLAVRTFRMNTGSQAKRQ